MKGLFSFFNFFYFLKMHIINLLIYNDNNINKIIFDVDLLGLL